MAPETCFDRGAGYRVLGSFSIIITIVSRLAATRYGEVGEVGEEGEGGEVGEAGEVGEVGEVGEGERRRYIYTCILTQASSCPSQAAKTK